jgi:hypothetical protein
LYVRQAAWLNTIPDKASKPRRETRGGSLPLIEAGAHILEALFEIGPCKPAGMGGSVAIDDLDMLAWQANQQLSLTPWEARAVRTLSHEYAAMLSRAGNAKCPPPYSPADLLDDVRRRKISEAMSSWADKLNEQRTRQPRKNRL